jgi:hypothetical protein
LSRVFKFIFLDYFLDNLPIQETLMQIALMNSAYPQSTSN